MRAKKSAGLSFEIIIVAAIGLVILIIMLMVFGDKVNLFSKSIECKARGGTCLSGLGSGNNECPADKPIIMFSNECDKMELKGERYVRIEPKERPGQCCIPLK